jgi:hypothetical protein
MDRPAESLTMGGGGLEFEELLFSLSIDHNRQRSVTPSVPGTSCSQISFDVTFEVMSAFQRPMPASVVRTEPVLEVDLTVLATDPEASRDPQGYVDPTTTPPGGLIERAHFVVGLSAGQRSTTPMTVSWPTPLLDRLKNYRAAIRIEPVPRNVPASRGIIHNSTDPEAPTPVGTIGLCLAGG